MTNSRREELLAEAAAYLADELECSYEPERATFDRARKRNEDEGWTLELSAGPGRWTRHEGVKFNQIEWQKLVVLARAIQAAAR